MVTRNDFFSAIASLQSRDSVKILLALLSDSESENLARRWEILKLLHQGYSQREVAQSTGSGILTVTRANRVLRFATNILIEAIDADVNESDQFDEVHLEDDTTSSHRGRHGY